MGKRRRRIIRSLDRIAVNYSLSDAERAKIEKSTKYNLSTVTWGLVEIATRRFIADASANAEKGVDVEEFRRLLKNVILSVAAIRSKLNSSTSAPVVAGLKDGNFQIYQNYFLKAWSDFKDDDAPFALLEATADAMLAVATHTAKNLSQDFSLAPPVGEAWDTWIFFICSFLTQAGHSCKVRKDTGDSGRSSPIVLFVAELEKTLPTQLRRFARSPAGLAQAINRANHENPALSSMRAKKGNKA